MSVTRRSLLWLTFAQILQRAISFITVPLFTRLLSTAEYGTVNVYMSWESIAFYVVTLAISYGGFNNGMVKYPGDKEGYTSSVVGLIILMGGIWFGICLFVAPDLEQLTGLAPAIIFLMLLQVIMQALYDVWTVRRKFDFDYRKVVAVSVLYVALTPTLGVIFVLTFADKVFGRILSFVIATAAVGLVGFVAVMKHSHKLVCLKYWKFTLLFNIPLLPHYLSQVILSSADRIIISAICSASDAGIYSIAYSAGMILTVFVSALTSTLTPWVYRRLGEKRYKDINRVTFMMSGMLAVLIFMLDALAPEIVAILAPSEYMSAANLIPVVAAANFFIFMYSACANVEFYYLKNKFAMIASLIAALLNIGLNLLLIPRLGYQVAGYTTLACYILLGWGHFLFAQRTGKQRSGTQIFNTRAFFMISIAVVTCSVVFALLYDLPFVRYAIVVAVIVVVIYRRDELTSYYHKLKKN